MIPNLPTNLPPVPVLHTERLVLRGHTASDFADVHALWSDPQVVEFITGKPSTQLESQVRLLRYIGHWAAYGFGYWHVEEKHTGDSVGDVGFGALKRDMTPPVSGEPEIGWVLATRHHGKGYATEAARAVLGWGDKHFGSTGTFCIFHPDNLGSIRVGEKLGFTFSHTAQYMGGDTPVYVRQAGREKR
ncbi:GNAT family N-acetyltransferase [Pelagibacterium sp.]|uniref:GNAT family N-acetyltransferase n=1 Tax=Pelagibacterium sp. TaxID=1967288 RepID=UPI003A9561CF